MPKNFLVFGNPSIEQAEIDEVVDALRSGWLGTGPKVHRFEEIFKQYKGTHFALAVNSCTAALHLSIQASGIQPDDEVIVPTITFASTTNAVIHAGSRRILADYSKQTMNIDPNDITRKIPQKNMLLFRFILQAGLTKRIKSWISPL